MRLFYTLEIFGTILLLSTLSFIVLAPWLQAGGVESEISTWTVMSTAEEVESWVVVPFLTGWATWYDYTLVINWTEKRWSKTHSTCALRIRERYKTYKVCSIKTKKCIECYHNDYWPQEYTNKVIDLSSYAFKKLWIPLKHWVAEVEIFTWD